MGNYQVTKHSNHVRERVLELLDGGPLTAKELADKIGLEKVPNHKLGLMVAEGELIKTEAMYSLPERDEDDALDKWFTSWVRPRRRHIRGTRLCNAMTNGIGGWWIRG